MKKFRRIAAFSLCIIILFISASALGYEKTIHITGLFDSFAGTSATLLTKDENRNLLLVLSATAAIIYQEENKEHFKMIRKGPLSMMAGRDSDDSKNRMILAFGNDLNGKYVFVTLDLDDGDFFWLADNAEKSIDDAVISMETTSKDWVKFDGEAVSDAIDQLYSAITNR